MTDDELIETLFADRTELAAENARLRRITRMLCQLTPDGLAEIEGLVADAIDFYKSRENTKPPGPKQVVSVPVAVKPMVVRPVYPIEE